MPEGAAATTAVFREERPLRLVRAPVRPKGRHRAILRDCSCGLETSWHSEKLEWSLIGPEDWPKQLALPEKAFSILCNCLPKCGVALNCSEELVNAAAKWRR